MKGRAGKVSKQGGQGPDRVGERGEAERGKKSKQGQVGMWHLK